jgi:hypothetical protein
VLGILQLIALLRFEKDLESGFGIWVYTAFVLSIAAMGIYGLLASRRSTVRATSY